MTSLFISSFKIKAIISQITPWNKLILKYENKIRLTMHAEVTFKSKRARTNTHQFMPEEIRLGFVMLGFSSSKSHFRGGYPMR
jgi:hypothetical protein